MPHPRVRPRTLMLLLALLALYGCSLTGRKAEPVETYVLETSETAAASNAPAAAPILRISTPTSVPEYATARMAYVEVPYRIDYFAQHAWADTPARMLKPLLTRQLTNSGLFHYVFSESTGVEETLRLDSTIVEFAQFFSETSSEVRVSIRFDLIDVVHRRMLVSQTIAITEPAAEREPYAGVVAANRAVQRALDQLVTVVKEPVAGLDDRAPRT
ncbi:MAG TPA: ABC-type transport auxiliary lipoprotein family protein [Pseudomonadales bacterium]